MNKIKEILSPLRNPAVGMFILLLSFAITGVLTCYQLNQEKQGQSAQSNNSLVGKVGLEETNTVTAHVASEAAPSTSKTIGTARPNADITQATTVSKVASN